MSTGEDSNTLNQLKDDVQSLKYDNERILKPQLLAINQKLDRDIYASKADLTKTEDALSKLNDRTKNYALVEKIVFGLVGIVLVTVIGALLALVVINNGGKG